MEETNNVEDVLDDDVICIGTPEHKKMRESVVDIVDLTEEPDDPETTSPKMPPVSRTPDTNPVFKTMRDILPDADPAFLLRKISELTTDADLHEFILNAVAEHNYPKVALHQQPIEIVQKQFREIEKDILDMSDVHSDISREILSVLPSSTNHYPDFSYIDHFECFPSGEECETFLMHLQNSNNISLPLDYSTARTSMATPESFSFSEPVDISVTGSINSSVGGSVGNSSSRPSSNFIAPPRVTSVAETVSSTVSETYGASIAEPVSTSYQDTESIVSASASTASQTNFSAMDESKTNTHNHAHRATIFEPKTNISPSFDIHVPSSSFLPISNTTFYDSLHSVLWPNREWVSEASSVDSDRGKAHTHSRSTGSFSSSIGSIPVPSTSKTVHLDVSQDPSSWPGIKLKTVNLNNKLLNKHTAVINITPYVHNNKVLPKSSKLIHSSAFSLPTHGNEEHLQSHNAITNSTHHTPSSYNLMSTEPSTVISTTIPACPPAYSNKHLQRPTVLVNSQPSSTKNQQVPKTTMVSSTNTPVQSTFHGNAYLPRPILLTNPQSAQSTHINIEIPRVINITKPSILPAPNIGTVTRRELVVAEELHRRGRRHIARQHLRRLERRRVKENLELLIRRMNNNEQIKVATAQNETIQLGGPSDERFILLSNILFGADPVNLRKEVTKIKNDEEMHKFLIRAFADEKAWNKFIGTERSPSKCSQKRKSGYKILCEMLPDASPTFLKRASAKLVTHEELQQFATKHFQEKNYPKRKYLQVKSDAKTYPDVTILAGSNNSTYLTLVDMLPDADPQYLLEQSKAFTTQPELEAFVMKAVEEKVYPKRDQFFKRQEFHKNWKKYVENFDIKEFLLIFLNPINYFYIEKKNSKNPLGIPLKFLQHRYRRKNANIFGVIYNQTGCSLVKTCDRLDAHFCCPPRMYNSWDGEAIFSTAVLQEIAFIQNRREIALYMLFKENIKAEAFEKARENGTLQECGCCYDERLFEDMIHCNGDHSFCITCVKRGSDVVIGNGGTTFSCYSDGCQDEFPLSALQNILSPEVFSRVLIRKQYEEVNAAGITGLETCNFCEFCSIPAPEDKLFSCLNPLCMKITCRSCKKLDHLPLSCEEFARKETQHKMQNYVEEKMTEALVRTCWQCNAKFVKESGCNMMNCKCGAKMCYECRQPINDYDHFSEDRCSQNFDTTVQDQQNVLNVGKQAKQEVEAANPGFQLVHDPTRLLITNKNTAESHQGVQLHLP